MPDTAAPPRDTIAPHLTSLAAACPLQAGPLRTTVADLALAVGWRQLRPLRLADTEWAVVVGHKRAEDPLRAVLPLPLHTTSLTPHELKAVFGALARLDVAALPEPLPPLAPSVAELQEKLGKTDQLAEVAEEPEPDSTPATFDPDTLYMAIVATDSTVVYYKLSRGIKKPHDIPDE
ncbi:hypothetical protein VHUM_01402 [Vanrija humicola]|uniref:tRNA-splicing endonuclease subunit Sen15 domain-containing protein n=1 Tax=Vanrija humicola TaxID=5417 RepID=A0A7D8V7V3_VANHU|nr:hypothetical protein VHUM_01402 [Vanrija humicola]